MAEVILCEGDIHRAGKQLLSDNCMIKREIVRKFRYGLLLWSEYYDARW